MPVDLAKIHPALGARVPTLLRNCLSRGAEYRVTCGLRTTKEQDALYAQGRTTPGKIVTNAKGGQSHHNYGCAVDFVRIIHDSASWAKDSYKILADEARKLGLESGYYWTSFSDAPHVQLPFALKALQTTYADGGLRAVYIMPI